MIRNHYNFNYSALDITRANPESMTQPGMALSIKDILDNFTRGVPMDVYTHDGYFSDDPDIDNPDICRDPAVDLFDVHAQLDQLKTDISKAKEPVETPAGEPVGEPVDSVV
jgi:hypothetical protein